MGEHKIRSSAKPKSLSSHHRKMASPSPGVSNLTALLQSATTGSATIVRCPAATLSRLRQLNDAEYITLFTPVVPHPPSTVLPKTMDPFEPLGRALSRHVRHVPYRMDNGMTETHADFLSSAGAVIIVICTTENVLGFDSHAFQKQAQFARDIHQKANENKALGSVPVALLLITNGTGRQLHEDGLKDFAAVFTCNNYTTSALANAVHVMFGR